MPSGLEVFGGKFGDAARRFFPSNRQSGNYSGPEVVFEEIAIDLLQARLWPITRR